MNQLAEEFLSKALSIKGTNPDLSEYYLLCSIEIDENDENYMYLGRLYASFPDRCKDAERAFEKAIRFQPSNTDALNEYGLFLMETGEITRAIKYFERALRSTNCSSAYLIYFNLALAWYKLNRKEKSLQYLKEALKYKKNFAAALDFLKELQPKSYAYFTKEIS